MPAPVSAAPKSGDCPVDAGRPRMIGRARIAVAAIAVLVAVAALAGGAWILLRQRPSVVLIVVDTLRADHLGAYGYSRPTTPSLDKWAQRGVVFERAHAPSPWTLPSFGSIYAGLRPSKHRAGATLSGEPDEANGGVIGEKRSFSGLDASVPTVSELLRDQGWETGAIANNVYLHPVFGVARGFQDYDYTPGSDDDFRAAGTIVDRALLWIESHRQKPFFLVVHFMDPHMNYGAPPPFGGRFTRAYPSAFSLPVHQTRMIRERAASLPAEDRMFITAAYDEEVAYVDDHIGRLLDELESRGVLRNAVVVLTADHGEELFDHDGFTHGHTMYEELLHVPLMVWAPGAEPGRVDAAVSLLDVTPTILAAVGVHPSAEFQGISLWPAVTQRSPLPSRVLDAEYTCIGPERKAIIEWPYKLVFTDDGSAPQFVDLETDPAESSDGAGVEPDVRRRLLAQLRATFPPDSETHGGEAVHLDQQTRERLRALGYLD